MKINEIFYSIQGESTRAGLPTVFVRTSGCHLRCTYCDTKYAYYEGLELTLDEILKKVEDFNCLHVCLTGGEPLLQKDSLQLMKRLCDLGYKVSLETSGDKTCIAVDSRVLKIIDIKTPDSGEKNKICFENLSSEIVNAEFKFVICSEQDFFWSEQFCKQHNLFQRSVVLYSPSFKEVDEKWLANKILLEKSLARLQLQLHKYIWTPETRGV